MAINLSILFETMVQDLHSDWQVNILLAALCDFLSSFKFRTNSDSLAAALLCYIYTAYPSRNKNHWVDIQLIIRYYVSYKKHI